MTSEFNIAVHALLVLDSAEDLIDSKKLAKSICTNPVRVRVIIKKLIDAKIVGSRSGKNGGYFLLENISDLTLKDVLEITNTEVVSSSWISGTQDCDCKVSKAITPVMEELYSELNEYCKKRLEEITLADVEVKMFGEKTEQ